MTEWSQVRIARPTDRLDEIITFYEVGLNLKRIAEFHDHEGYDGVMFGLPGAQYHLEFTSYVDGSPCPAPTKDNLLVFYFPNKTDWNNRREKLLEMGYKEVASENPYWNVDAVTFEDPDGWRIVLVNNAGL